MVSDNSEATSVEQNVNNSRVVIAGSRGFINDVSLVCSDHVAYVDEAVRRSGFEVDEVISGTANGADTAGEQWADRHSVPVTQMPADWDKHGNRAGPKRNEAMAAKADAVIVLWDGSSTGSASMIDKAREADVPLYVHKYREDTFDLDDDRDGGQGSSDGGDDDEPSDDVSDNSDETIDDPSLSKYSLERLTQVGGVRSYRLTRDLDITTIAGVADAGLERLTEVWSIGEHTAMKIKGSAQGFVNRFEAQLEADRAELKANRRSPGPETVGRVAVLMRDDFETVDTPDLVRIVDDALDKAGVEVGDDTTLGWVGDNAADDPVGEMGGVVMERLYEKHNAMGELVGRHVFQTPWSKYAGYFGWYADDEEKPFTEKDYPVFPDECPDTNDIPFDTPRGLDDVEQWMAPKERTQEMVEWADAVVIPIEGEYTSNIRYECLDQQVPCETVYDAHVAPDGDVTLTPWADPEAPDTLDISDADTITGRQGTELVPKTDENGEQMTDDAGRPLYEEVLVDREAYDDSKEWREGSPNEMAPDDALTMEPNDSLEQRPEINDDSAGSGIGSKSDRTGEYPDRLL